MKSSFIERYKRIFNQNNVTDLLLEQSVYSESNSIRLLNNKPLIKNKEFSIMLTTKTETNTEHDDE